MAREKVVPPCFYIKVEQGLSPTYVIASIRSLVEY